MSTSGWLRGVPGASAPDGCELHHGIEGIPGVAPKSLELLQATFATKGQLERGARQVSSPLPRIADPTCINLVSYVLPSHLAGAPRLSR